MRCYNRTQLTEYKYDGVFFVEEQVAPEDGDLLSGDVATEEDVILEVKCDIQQASHLFTSGAIIADYYVYFATTMPQLPIRNGMSFRCDNYGVPLQGMVAGIEAGQMGCKVLVKTPDLG